MNSKIEFALYTEEPSFAQVHANASTEYIALGYARSARCENRAATSSQLPSHPPVLHVPGGILKITSLFKGRHRLGPILPAPNAKPIIPYC